MKVQPVMDTYNYHWSFCGGIGSLGLTLKQEDDWGGEGDMHVAEASLSSNCQSLQLPKVGDHFPPHYEVAYG